MIIIGPQGCETKPLYGLSSEIKSIVQGIPNEATRVKLKLRNMEFARAFCKTPNGIREFIIFTRPDGNWELGLEQGRNARF